MGLDKGKIIRTWRLALTCTFLFLISWYYQIPESSWSLVTIWFVMYEYNTVGGVLNKSKLRFWGTIISALYGITIIYWCGNDPIINILALIVGLFFYTYWFMGNDKTYTGTIGAVTLTIVLLNYNDIELAILRALNVIIGIIASVFMIQFFYPQYAKNFLREMQITWFNQLLELIKNYTDLNEDYLILKKESYDLELKFLDNLPNYNRLVNESKMEMKEFPLFPSHCLAIKDQFQRLFRLLSFLISTLSSNEIRAHPWINEQLVLISNQLYAIKAELLNEELPRLPLKNEDKEEIEILEINLNNKEAIENLLQEVNLILAALAQHVGQISSIKDLR